MSTTSEIAESFILKHARPLDYELYCLQRGESNQQAVLEALAAYQNADGGFGGPLEPDNFCPFSLPLTSWKAITYLRKIGCFDSQLPLVKGLVDFLQSCRRKDGYWNTTDPRTQDYPHAPWWQDQGEAQRVWGFNPTAEISAYLLQIGVSSEIGFMKSLINRYLDGSEVSMHELVNLMVCYSDLKMLNWNDLERFEAKLRVDLEAQVSKSREGWQGYGLRLSMFSDVMDPVFLTPYQDLIRAEQAYLAETQADDGSWELNWDWGNTYPDFWPVAKRWWQAIQAIQYLQFLRL